MRAHCTSHEGEAFGVMKLEALTDYKILKRIFLKQFCCSQVIAVEVVVACFMKAIELC